MRITALKAYPVWVGHRNQLILKIETDEGIFGWGESGLSGREKAVMGAIEHYAEMLKGQDPRKIGWIWQRLYRSQYFEGGRVLTAAMSAIDIALHDIKGKALGVPVYELLGGKQRDLIPTFASTGAAPGPKMIEQAREIMATGWSAIRLSRFKSAEIFEPREAIAKTANWMVRAREELGDEVVLGIDWHHQLTVAEAASFCQKLPTGTLDFLEEPIRAETPEAYESLRRLTDIPFAIGEECSSKWQFVPLIERNIHQFNRIDICNVGGLTEAMKVAGWSEAHYVDMMPHNPLGPICTAATVHFSAAVANYAWLETRTSPGEPEKRFDDESLFPVAPRIENAHYRVSNAPGLGVEVNEELLTRDEFRYWQPPQLRRGDGSVTNW